MNWGVGDTVILDDIESVIIYNAGGDYPWGNYIVMDKYHDLSYYISGNDFIDEKEPNETPVVINNEAKYGYEWGYKMNTGVTSQVIGDGLSNTNSLIALNLQSETEGWPVLWDMVVQFRSTHTDKWFVPTVNELKDIYTKKHFLSNLSTSTQPWYWASTDGLFYRAYTVSFENGTANGTGSSSSHANRARLCRYTTKEELDELYRKKTWVVGDIISANELNRIERKVNTNYPVYSPTKWIRGDGLSKERLNKIETRIGSEKIWEDGNIVTAEDLNNIENLLEP